MALLFGAFFAGIITVFAPCVLPLLPVIIGGSVTGDTLDKRRPLIVALSLGLSLFAFTVLLKATTLLITIPPYVITYISGAIVLLLGVALVFPRIYARFILKTGVEGKANALLGKGALDKRTLIGPILTGAALGPVFSSCSPVYVYILAVILPASFSQALLYIASYIAGLCLILLIIGYAGQRFVSRITFLSDPYGPFQRIVAILFIIVGLLIISGYDKRFQAWVSENTAFNFDAVSARFLPESEHVTHAGLFNVAAYKAPEIVGVTDWINSKPLALADLKGKVVLIDFWTYSCINCIRSIPYVEKWYEAYKDAGFVVIGLHAPEFAFERVRANVEKAVADFGLTYPVGLDNNYATWSAFDNHYWPAHYLIDAKGDVRRVHFGEGEYLETEEAIRALLEENGARLAGKAPMTSGEEAVPITRNQTPETYLGTARADSFVGTPSLFDGVYAFKPAPNLPTDGWTLAGRWHVDGEKIGTIGPGQAILWINVSAKDVYIVADALQTGTIKVLVDGVLVDETIAGKDVKGGMATIDGARLYHLVSFNEFGRGKLLELQVSPGVSFNAFTFGS